MTTSADKPQKPVRKKGPLRLEAIIPIAIICTTTYLYFLLFFDSHLKALIEWGGYNTVGAEVDVASLKTSFTEGSIRITGIQLTDAEEPTRNLFEVGDIRFNLQWDALLRVKFVVEEAAVENIKYGTARTRPGRVKPPEPPSNKPSPFDKETEKLKEQAVEFVTDKYNDNVVGDLAKILNGANYQDQLNGVVNSLPSKQKAAELDTEYKSKDKLWQQKLQNLPQQKDFQALNDRLNKVKSSGFKSPQELQASLQEYDAIFKELDAKLKIIQSTKEELGNDLNKAQADVKQFEALIKTDVKSLENRFQIPRLDAKEITLSLFDKYLGPYKAKINRYKTMLFKYLPPKFTADKETKAKVQAENEAEEIIPHERANGVTYEFGRPLGYPLFWVKKTLISSQAGATPDAGFVKGEIRDLTINQKMVGRPTVAKINGDFPANGIKGVALELSLDNTKEESLITAKGQVAVFPLGEKTLLNSPDASIGFTKAQGKITVDAWVKGFKNYSLKMQSLYSEVAFNVSAKDKIADEILKRVFKGLPAIQLAASAEGTFPQLPLKIESNLGSEIEKGFRSAVQAKIDEARKNIEAAINAEIGKFRDQINRQVADLRSKIDGEVKKAEQTIQAQKDQIQGKIEQAKKDTENKAKKGLEDEAKKKAEELKKRLGF